MPHRDDGSRVLAVVDEPQGQGLHALLRVAQLRELLLQRRLGEGGHGGGDGALQGAAWAAQCGEKSDGTRPGPHLTACEALYRLTDCQGGKEGEGMGLRSNSRPRRRHKMATDLSPRREKGQRGRAGVAGHREVSELEKYAPPVAVASLNLAQGTSKGTDREGNAVRRPPEGAFTARARTQAQ